MNSENPIFRSLALIEERIQEKLTVENLAESIHLSRFHYQRMFREAVGDSVMRYVTRRRLTLAAGELASDEAATVLEIALKYGYDTHEDLPAAFGLTWASIRQRTGNITVSYPPPQCKRRDVP